MALVKMKDIQQNKTTSAPAAVAHQTTSGIVPMSTIKANRAAAAKQVPVQTAVPQAPVTFNPNYVDPTVSPFIQHANDVPPAAAQPFNVQQDSSFAAKVQHENFLDWLFKDNPVSRILNRPFAAAAEHAIPDASYLGQPGTNARQDYLTRNPIASTGNATLDKVEDFAGGMGSMFVPIGGGSPIINDLSKVTGALGNTKMGKTIIDAAGKAGAKAANVINPALNNFGMHLSTDLAQKAGQNFAKGSALGELYGATDPFTYGEGNLSDVPGSMASNALMFGVGDAAIPFLGAGLSKATKAVAEKNAFKKAVDEFITRTQQVPVNDDGVSTAYATAGKQGLIQEAPSAAPKASIVTMKEIQAAREQVKPVEAPVPPAIAEPLSAAQQKVNESMPVKDQKLAPKPLPEKLTNPHRQTGDDLTYYTHSLYRETDANGAIELIPGSVSRNGSLDQTDLYFANTPELALGQGTNKGIVIEMDAKGIEGHLDTNKPSWKMLYDNGAAEFITVNDQHKYMDAVKSVTIKPDAVMERVPKLQLQRILADWEKVKNTDGSVTYLRPEAAAKVEPAAAEVAATSNLVKMADVQAMRAKGQVSAQAPKQPRSLETAAVQEDVKNYAGNHMPFRTAIGQTERTINRNKVISNLRKNLGVTIDTGRLGPGTKNVLGLYKTRPEVIRSGMAEDIQTISHEIGHHLDKKFNLQDPYFRSELDSLMQFTGHNTGAYTAAQQLEEGVAEYVRLYLTDRNNALKYAPVFTEHFEEQLSAKALKGLEASAKDIDTWITQGDYNQAKGLIDFDSTKRKPTIFSWNKFYTRFVDDLNPIKLAEKALTGRIGIGGDSAYKMARLTRGLAERAKLAVTDGIYINGTKVSEGLQQIVKPLEELGIKESDFATYLTVKHAIDLKAQGKRVPFTDSQIAAVMDLDIPEVQAVQKKIVGFNNALTDILVDAQILDPMAVTEMRKKYPNYVPFMRHFEEDAEAGFKNGGFGAASAFVNITNPIKRMSEEGSFRTIVNPIESMAKNAFLTMNAAAKNKVGLQIGELSKVEGAGEWIEKVSGGSSPHEHVINVFEKGERQAYKIREPELYNAMLTLDHESSTALIRFLGGAAGFLRAGATLTPEFMLRNSTRDVMEAFIKVGMHPVDFAKGLVAVLGKSDAYHNFLTDGGAMGTMMALDREALQREAMSKIFRKSLRDKTLDVVTSPKQLTLMLTGVTPAKKAIGVLRRGAEISELSTKVGTYKRVLKKTGSREEAAYVARDLMDFNRAGSNIRQSNRVIAFLNASLQGTDGMLRAFKQNKSKYLIRAIVGLSLPAIANYYVNKNLDPENRKLFENIPQWQKDSFFIVHVPGTNKFARIPKPFEVGAIFATGTERLMRALDEHDPDAFKGYGKSLLTSVTPPILLSMYTPLLEAITNYSFFKGTPVVSQSYDKYEKQDQYDPIKTSETAKLLGKAASAVGLGNTNAASPLIIDNTIHGYTGGLGQYAIAGMDKILSMFGVDGDTPKPAKNWDESMLARPFFASTSGGGQVRNDFYSKWDKLSAAKSSADLNEESYTDPDYERMKNAKSYIDKALKRYKLIKNDKSMNSEEKRRQLDSLDDTINNTAAQGLGK